jgi:transposase
MFFFYDEFDKFLCRDGPTEQEPLHLMTPQVPQKGLLFLRHHSFGNDDYFPEWKKIFWAMNSKGLWAILETCPFPEDVLKLEKSAIADIIAKASRSKAEGARKALAVHVAAQTSIGLTRIGGADRYRLRVCLNEVRRTEGMLKEIQKELKDLLNQLPSAQYLLSIPGVGYLSAAVFLGELGNPAYFHHAKQIIKYAGYDPQESDSGKRIGRKVISKKGRWLLRKYLYLMSLRAVAHTSLKIMSISSPPTSKRVSMT